MLPRVLRPRVITVLARSGDGVKRPAHLSRSNIKSAYVAWRRWKFLRISTSYNQQVFVDDARRKYNGLLFRLTSQSLSQSIRPWLPKLGIISPVLALSAYRKLWTPAKILWSLPSVQYTNPRFAPWPITPESNLHTCFPVAAFSATTLCLGVSPNHPRQSAESPKRRALRLCRRSRQPGTARHSSD